MLVLRRLCLAATAALFALPVVGAHAAAPTFYLSPTGSDSAACSQSAPCKSFSRGYTVASPGSEVVLAAGLLRVAVALQPGGQVRLGQGALPPGRRRGRRRCGSLTISNSDNIEVRDVKTSGWGVTNGSAHIILRRVFAGDVVVRGRVLLGLG